MPRPRGDLEGPSRRTPARAAGAPAVVTAARTMEGLRDTVRNIFSTTKSSGSKQLVIRECSLTDADLEVLAPELRTLDGLEALVLEHNTIGDGGARALAAQLQHLPTLRRIDLDDNRIGDEGAAALAAQLHHLPRLQALLLNLNRIGTSGTVSIARALGEHPPPSLTTLTGVDLSPHLGLLSLSESDVPRGPGADPRLASADPLTRALIGVMDPGAGPLGSPNTPILRALRARSSGHASSAISPEDPIDVRELSPADRRALVGATVRRGPDWKWRDQDGGPGSTGTILSVEGFSIVGVRWENGHRNHYRAGAENATDLVLVSLPAAAAPIEGAVAVPPRAAERLAEARLGATELMLWKCDIDDEMLSRTVAPALERLPHLLSLRLDDNRFGDAGAASLAAALPKLPRLFKLALDGNRVTESGMAAFLGALPAAPKLRVLLVYGNTVGDAGARALAGALPSLPELELLRLDDAGIGDAGAEPLFAALEHVPMLRRLDLDKNRLTDAALRSLAPALAHVPRLVTLYLNHNAFTPLGAAALAAAMGRHPMPHLRQLGGVDLPAHLPLLGLRADELPAPEDEPSAGDPLAGLAAEAAGDALLQRLVRAMELEAGAARRSPNAAVLQALRERSPHAPRSEGPSPGEELDLRDLTPAQRAALVGATVRRGPHWKWGDQDGGGSGRIQEVKANDWVHVAWASGRANGYRAGAESACDLCLVALGRPMPGPDALEEGALTQEAKGKIRAAQAARKLDLSAHGLSPAHAPALAAALGPLAGLAELWLQDNALGDGGAAALAPALVPLSGLRVLCLAENGVGASGSNAVFAALRALEALEELRYAGNRAGDEGAGALAAQLRYLRALRVLDLRRNRVGDEGAAALGGALRMADALRELMLEGNVVSDAGARDLARGLARAPELRALRLRGNHVSDHGLRAVGELGAALAHLEDIGLEDNHVGDAGLAAFAAHVGELSGLRALRLEGNMVGPVGARAFAAAIAGVRPLRLREASGFDLTEQLDALGLAGRFADNAAVLEALRGAPAGAAAPAAAAPAPPPREEGWTVVRPPAARHGRQLSTEMRVSLNREWAGGVQFSSDTAREAFLLWISGEGVRSLEGAKMLILEAEDDEDFKAAFHAAVPRRLDRKFLLRFLEAA